MTQSVFLLLALAGNPVAENEAGVLRADFRGRPIDEKLFVKVVGNRAADDERIRTDAGGLRITLPAGSATPLGEYGLRARFGVKGDFEITTSYELLEAELAEAPAVGVAIYIRTEAALANSMMLGRFNRRGNGSNYEAFRGMTVEGRRQFSGDSRSTQATAGKLRLIRRGGELTCLAADAGDDTFVQIDKLADFGPEDLIFIRIAGQKNGRSEANFDARFHDLEIRSPQSFGPDGSPLLMDASVTPASPARPSLTRGWLVTTEILVVVVLVIMLALWRRRERIRDRAAVPNLQMIQAEDQL